MYCQFPKQDERSPCFPLLFGLDDNSRKHFYIPSLCQILATISLDYHQNQEEAVKPLRSLCLPLPWLLLFSLRWATGKLSYFKNRNSFKKKRIITAVSQSTKLNPSLTYYNLPLHKPGPWLQSQPRPAPYSAPHRCQINCHVPVLVSIKITSLWGWRNLEVIASCG